MAISTPARDRRARYRDDPSVITVLRSPRLLTREALAGLVVAMALIPEAISFSIIAGVDPRVGLFSSFVMAVTIAFVGGRPAMISAATGAVALVIAPIMRDHGFDYFIATVLLAGAMQIVLALLGVARLMRFIPRSVMVGFVNALAMALVGLMESLLTAKLVDDITDTRSNKTRESAGQGIANLLSGFFGGMGGCAVIGQTMINVKVSGARSRVSTFLAGVFVLVLVVVLGDVVALIPMAALVAVMIMVVISTFDWHSIRPSTLRRMPRSETLVMVVTVVVVVITHNLAIGVIVGVLVAMVLFARRVAHFQSVTRTVTDASAHYRVEGELFFASSNDLTTQFSYADDPEQVVIDLTGSHIWDASTVAALDAIETKYARLGKTVSLVGLNAASTSMRDRMTGQLGGE